MSKKISWIQPEDLISYELRQRREEGLDVAVFEKRWQQVQRSLADPLDLQREATKLLTELNRLTAPEILERQEPSQLERIMELCPVVTNDVPLLDNQSLADRIHGGWLGRAAGCLLGKPVEKIPRAGIREILTSNQSWPLSNYITAAGIPEELLGKYPWNRHSGRESLRENIVCMTEDDDLNYPMINLYVLETYGHDFRTEDIAESWLSLMPVLRSFTAERVAYINTLQLIPPPESAITNNPYREWIGAQIRADIWGWVSPGRPRKAARLAWRDAQLSHVRNGIYGEMFVAALIAAAAYENDPGKLLTEGLKHIPPRSRLAAAIRFVISLSEQEKDYENALDAIYEKFGEYHWVHSINNAALVAAALLYGEGDFEKSICNVVMGGWDTDSNGATVGSILGTMLGAQQLPAKWIAPLDNRIRSSLKGFDNSEISALAFRTAAQVK